MTQIETILRNQFADLQETDFSQFIDRPEEKMVDLNSRLAQVVIGVRRSGKSTLCQKVLMRSGVNFAYVNFDDEILSNLGAEQLNDIIEILYRIHGKFTHLFLDEIQNAPSWPLFVNRLLRSGLHLIITGSNANLLGDDLVTHMAGRYNDIRLYPFSFAEYCRALQVDTETLTTKAVGLRANALDQYLINGGFPETIGSSNSKRYISSLLQVIIQKDIRKRYNVRYVSTLQQLANSTLDNFCQEMDYEEIGNNLSIKSLHTVRNYVSYLNNAYLIRLVNKYSYKSRIRQSTAKCYAIDPAFVTNHANVLQPDNLGWRLENVIAIELLRRLEHTMQNVYYIRESNSYEVDFAVTDGNHVIQLIQVTYDFSNPSTKLYNREIKGLVKAAKTTGCNNLMLVMMYGETGDDVVDGLTIHRVSAIDWLLRHD